MEASAAPRPARPALRRPASLVRLAGDERLVADVRAGSEAAFEVLFDRHHRGVLGFCRHMLGSTEEAEDAVQHTFMAAYRDMVASEKPIQLKAWLYTIARNRCLTILRSRREQPSDALESLSTNGLAEEVQQRQDLRDLLRDVASLPDDQRAALVLAEVGDLGHDEIAAILDCPKAKVKALVFQARSSLAASRRARETPCAEIREQLANLRGGSLRRTTLKRHVRECPGCREFKAELDHQRRALAIVLPVLPALGLKEAVLGAILGGGGGAAGGAIAIGGGAAAATGAGAFGAKALVVLAVVGGGGTAGVVAFEGADPPAKGAPAAKSAPAKAPARGQIPARSGVPAASLGESETDSTSVVRTTPRREPAAKPRRSAAKRKAARRAAKRKRAARLIALKPRTHGKSRTGAPRQIKKDDDQRSPGNQQTAATPPGGGGEDAAARKPKRAKKLKLKPKSRPKPKPKPKPKPPKVKPKPASPPPVAKKPEDRGGDHDDNVKDRHRDGNKGDRGGDDDRGDG